MTVIVDGQHMVEIFEVGDEGADTMPWSEVCMHMRIADKVMRFRVVGSTGNEMVQLLNEDGTPFSFPITPGEAGLYRNHEGKLYR